MPSFKTMAEKKMFARLLIYGPQKARKTWWAATAAEAGFNVLLLDCDDGWQIIKQLSPEAQSRIYVIDIVDKPNANIASIFAAAFLRQKPFYWREEEKKLAVLRDDKEAEDAIYIDTAKLDGNTVVVLDSWTELVNSLNLQFAKENGIDLADASKPEWEGYRWTGALATWMLGKLKTLPCHIALVGHQTVYEKIRQEKKQQIVEWSREQLVSTSGKHAMTIGQKFSDILQFKVLNETNVRIDTGAGKDKEGGSRIIPPKVYRWEDLQFKDYCNLAGITLPPPDLPYLDFSAPSAATEEKEKQGKPTIKPATEAKAKPSSLFSRDKLRKN